MSITRRELIIQKYCALELELSQYFDNSLFPSLDEVDLADMVTYITRIFWAFKQRRIIVAKFVS